MLLNKKIKKNLQNIFTAECTFSFFKRPLFLAANTNNTEIYSEKYESSENTGEEGENPEESFQKSEEKIKQEIADTENRLNAMDKNNHDEYSRLVSIYNILQEQFQIAKDEIYSEHAKNLQEDLERLQTEQESFSRTEQQRRYQQEQENAKHFFVNTDMALNREYPTDRSTTDPRYGNLKGRLQLQYFKADGKEIDLAAEQRGDALNALPQYNPDGTPKEYKVEPPIGSGGHVRNLLWSQNNPGKPQDGGYWIWQDESHLKPRREARPQHGSYFSEIPKEKNPPAAEAGDQNTEKNQQEAVPIIDTVLSGENSPQIEALKQEQVEKISQIIIDEMIEKPDEKTEIKTRLLTDSFKEFIFKIEQILEKPQVAATEKTAEKVAALEEVRLEKPQTAATEKIGEKVAATATTEKILPPETKTIPQKILEAVMKKITAHLENTEQKTPKNRQQTKQAVNFINKISEKILNETSEPNKNLTTTQLLGGTDKLSTAELLTTKPQYQKHEEEISAFCQWKDLNKKYQDFEQILT